MGQLGHRPTVGRGNPELPEECVLPAVDRPQDNRDDAGLPLVVSLQGTLQLEVVAVVGGDEVGTDQQEDDPGGVEVLVDLPLPLGPRGNLPVVPAADDPGPLQDAQVL